MEHDIADVMAHLSRQVEAATDSDDALVVIVRAAVELIPGVGQASVTIIHRRGQVETAAASSEDVTGFDQIQYDAGEGPCLTTLDPQAPRVLVAADLRRDQRWPHYIPRILTQGVTAQVAARLSTRGRSQGSLNLYFTGSDEVTPQAVKLAELFAAYASLALDRAHTEANLRLALETRTTIGEAIGIVRERYGLTQDQAVAYLTRKSQQNNTKVRELAAHITQSVDDGTRQQRGT